MHKSNVHQVEYGNLICKLKTADSIKLYIYINACGELGKQGDGVCKVALEVGLVLWGGNTLISERVGLYEKVCNQCNQTLLMMVGEG